ncbi:uncharacterized protein LOC126671221 [Mercurialis annua]|uniref:uncharacterized protein LOC126671221 n=1 Tax=Mercurialis annua TaxID=3986 RepID=UPI0021607426|nr:uncharacterized protein LOC126671221 [Mercurialis annua]
MSEGEIPVNGFDQENKGNSDLLLEKVDPATPASLTWQRKLYNEDIELKQFSLSFQEKFQMVFLATDDDDAPVICFLLQEQKKLLSVRLQSLEIYNEIIFDVKPDMSWSITAIAAEPVAVTRPRGKLRLLPYSDIIVLAPQNTILLYNSQCESLRWLDREMSDYLLKNVNEIRKELHDLKNAADEAREEQMETLRRRDQINELTNELNAEHARVTEANARNATMLDQTETLRAEIQSLSHENRLMKEDHFVLIKD